MLLAATAGAYFWNLSASSYGNTFYAAAVEAGSKSWKAMLFGSLDSSNFITVDKPPASLWVMDLSVRIFGFHTWSVLGPQVIEGVLAVALLYGAVRRVAGPVAGLAAGTVLATTPVAALMFRFDNPDALLVLLMTAGAYCVTRAVERAGTAWLIGAGAAVGFAFLTKMLQGFIVVPAFAAAYLLAAPVSLRRRLLQLLAAGIAIAVSAGWWLAIVALTPTADRPMIDGSATNSIFNLIFDYNGFGRLTGGGSGPGGGGGASFSGSPGWWRLLNTEMGGQAAWLLPAALVALVAIFVARSRTVRVDRIRAAAVLWGGWLIVTAAVFSFGRGIIHTYYTVALAPAIAALAAIGGQQLWEARAKLWARVAASAAVALTAWLGWHLLDRTPAWHPWLRWLIVVAGVVGVVAIFGSPVGRRIGRWVGVVVAGAVLVACLSGPVAYAANTLATGHTGSTPAAGPTGGGANGAPGGFGGGARGGPGGFGGSARAGVAPAGSPPAGSPPAGSPSAGSRPTGSSGAGGGGGGLAGTAGPGGATTTSSALITALQTNASRYRWVAAVSGSQAAASLELATSGAPVMAIGGFNGQGGNLSLGAFESYVAKGDIHYYIASAGGAGGPGGGGTSSAITAWVEAHYTAQTIGGQTVYDLTSPK